jgi:hypothetical protein
MLPTRLLRVAVVGFAVLAVACGDLTRPKATYANALATYTMYGLTTAPATAPNALTFLSGASHASATFLFDVAFDIDATGRAVIYPVRTIAGAPVGTAKRVGLQTVSGSFDATRVVPQTGYDTVSVKTVNPGTVLAVELRDATACFSYSLVSSQFLYAKMVVTASIRQGEEALPPHGGRRDCGYFSVVRIRPHALMLDARLIRERPDDVRTAMRRRGALGTLGPLVDRAVEKDKECVCSFRRLRKERRLVTPARRTSPAGRRRAKTRLS